MSNNPMVDQVNRLLGDLLTSDVEVFLPGVGTLYTERRGAQRVSRRAVLPPVRRISFSSQERGESLVERISSVVGCEKTEAREVYERWLSRTFVDDVLTIEGVGVLKFKNFTVDAAFDKRLNPQGYEPVKVKPARGMDWFMWVGLAAVVVAICAGGLVIWNNYGDLHPTRNFDLTVVTPVDRADEPVELEPADVTAMAEPVEVAPSGQSRTTTTTQQPAGPSDQPLDNASGQSQRASTGTADAPASLVSGRNYVVFGVFSTLENAARAAAGVAAKDASMQCGIYRFGEKFMVSPFEADSSGACTSFIREKRTRFPDLWTYTAR